MGIQVKMSCLLLSGFKGTGKDTLYSNINADLKTLGYKCYKAPENKTTWDQVVKSVKPSKRLSFADPLKIDIAKKIIAIRPDLTLGILEANKDKAIKDIMVSDSKVKLGHKSQCNNCLKELSFRDHLIEHAYIKRLEDHDYWCKRSIQGQDNKSSIVVTDFRYPNEYIFMSRLYKTYTVWIFRKSVEIPSQVIHSEWALHNEQMDYLITDDFEGAIKLRPQYKDYIECF